MQSFIFVIVKVNKAKPFKSFIVNVPTPVFSIHYKARKESSRIISQQTFFCFINKQILQILLAAEAMSHLQPLISQGLHVFLNVAGIRIWNLLYFSLQIFSCADKQVHVFLFFSQLSLDSLMLQGQG